MKKLLACLMALSVLVTACSSGAGETAGSDQAGSGEELVIGIIQYMDHVSLDAANRGFQEELEASGKKVRFIEQNANGDLATVSQIGAKFQAEEVDLVYAIATPAAQGMQNQLDKTPLVFSAVTDPQGADLVESLESPGGNMTGVSDYIDPKTQLERFISLYPEAKTIGVIYNTGEQNSRVQVEELRQAAESLGLGLKEVGISQIADVSQAIASLAKDIDGLFALTDNMVASAGPTVAKALLDKKIPSVSAEEGQVKNGLLFSEGVNYEEHGRQAGRMALKILEGQAPKDLPVEFNEVNHLLVNEETAKALGLDLNHPALQEGTLVK
ncbi:MAG: ABC transporter substrate-binding protein [Tissierellia bacterium]|nr:ABC transporter substrate-binding protein [Tissierellia bacterium]